MRNAEIAVLLDKIADLLELKGDDRFRVGAYRMAARRIESMPEDVQVLWREVRLQEIPGVGQSIATKIGEYLETGKSEYLESLGHEVPPDVRELLLVPGLGPARALLMNRLLGISTLPELERAAREQRLRELPGIRARTEEKILRELDRLKQRSDRPLLGVVLPVAEEIARLVGANPLVQRVEPAGSLRRMRETIGDIDLLAASARPAEVTEAFVRLPFVREVLGKGPAKASILIRDNLQIDLRVVKPDAYGAALQYFTGSQQHNVALREIAIRKGYKLSEYGLFETATNRKIAGEDEEGVYRALGLEWIPPELRENRGEIDAAAQGRLPQLLAQEDLLGDLHVHSRWSDGTGTLKEMAERCIAMGYRYAAITDHSQRLGVARGLAARQLGKRAREIDELNEELAPFRLLKGAEVDILFDGSLDYRDEVLAELDIVVASIHSGFDQDRERITERILRAMRNPHVDVLAHPTGRLLGKRQGYEVDLERVLREAARSGVAIEINATPDRLDLDDAWTHRAKELRVMLCINTDAHSPTQLGFMRYGVAVARRGWLEKGNVLNTLSAEELLGWRRTRLERRAA